MNLPQLYDDAWCESTGPVADGNATKLLVIAKELKASALFKLDLNYRILVRYETSKKG